MNNAISEIEKRNVILISISNDSARTMKKYKEKKNYPIIFAPDKGGKIAKSFKVYLSQEHSAHDELQVDHAIPSKFLINKEGIIVWKYIGSKTERPSIEMIINAIDKYL